MATAAAQSVSAGSEGEQAEANGGARLGRCGQRGRGRHGELRRVGLVRPNPRGPGRQGGRPLPGLTSSGPAGPGGAGPAEREPCTAAGPCRLVPLQFAALQYAVYTTGRYSGSRAHCSPIELLLRCYCIATVLLLCSAVLRCAVLCWKARTWPTSPLGRSTTSHALERQQPQQSTNITAVATSGPSRPS